MAQNTTLNGLVYFEAVARQNTLTAAASELSVSPSAVSQQITALEQRLGVHLFRRVKRRLVLTEEGERLFVAASDAMKLIRDARDRISLKRAGRSLNIRVSASFGIRWLSPRIAPLVDANPDWDLHIDATPEVTDFERENIDLDIRYGPGQWPGLYTEPVLTDAVLPLAAPGLLPDDLSARSPEQAADMLAGTRLIHSVKSDLQWRDWLNRHGIDGIDTDRGLRFDRSLMTLQAAQDGAGVALESASLAFEALKSGALIPALTAFGASRFPAYWLICPSRNLQRRSVRTFADWLRAEAAGHETERNALLESLGCALA